jgi:hypothetical protein
VPGTLVVLADGSVAPIESLRVGDEVLATDPVTGETTGEPVVATITGSGVKDLVTITVTTDTGASGEVTATVGHPFWVADRGVWVGAGDLLRGDWLRTSSGTWVQVSAVEHDHREQTVHNLTVDTVHTYYVYAGETAVLSHNCGGGGVAAKSGDEFINLASDARTTHILYGDRTGGGHLWPGLPGKTPFPQSGTAQRVMHEISDVATDPTSIFQAGRGGSTVVTGVRDGVLLRVITRGDDIVTGYPTNLPRIP